MASRGNIFDDLSAAPAGEEFRTLLETPGVKIERIVSRAHASPDGFWYDQDHDEWVMVLQGDADLRFEDGATAALKAGDFLLIPKHAKHRVDRTSAETVWLAVHVALPPVSPC